MDEVLKAEKYSPISITVVLEIVLWSLNAIVWWSLKLSIALYSVFQWPNNKATLIEIGVWSGGVTDAQFYYREWVLNMNTIDVMKGEKCIVRWFYGSAQPSGWCRRFIAQEQWKRYDIIAKMVKQVLLGSFCRYRKALYFWSLGISLYLELFCFLSFITIVLRNLCSGTRRRNLLLVAWQNSQTSKTSWRVTAMLLTLWCEHKIKRKIIVTA